MEMRLEAIVLGKKDIGETDRIYTFFTKEKGKLQAVARGVRKGHARLAGSLENFSHIDLALAKGRGTGRVTGAILENGFINLRENFELLRLACDSMKMFHELVGWEEKDDRLFALLLEYLAVLDFIAREQKAEKGELVNVGFSFKLTDALGYPAETAVCVFCYQPIAQGKNYFSASDGGVVCPHCASGKRNLVAITPSAIKLLRLFTKYPLSGIAKLAVKKEDLDNARLVFREFSKWNVR